MTNRDDERAGRLLAAVRHRLKLTQREIAARAEVPRDDVLRIEHGAVGTVPLDRTRRIFEVVEARVRLDIWWNGAAADRILDERHARLVERALAVFRRRGWLTAVEVSFSEYGERGSIDLLAAHPPHLAVAVVEIKTEFGSLEETNRVLDAKERLAPAIAAPRFGWRPRMIGRILIVPDSSGIRQTVAAHALTMSSTYPATGREVRAWLRSPTRPIRGIWFLSEVAGGDRGSR